MLKEMVRSLGLDPERILVKDEILEPHRTSKYENREKEILQEPIRGCLKRIAVEGDE